MSDLFKWGYFAENSWHHSSGNEWIDSFNPTNGEVWARISNCTNIDVDHAVSSAKTAFENGAFVRMTATDRGRLLRRIADQIRKNASRLGHVETTDNGKLFSGIKSGLEGWLTDSLDYYAGLADKIEGANIPVDVPNILNYTRREPYGPVACITAWNSPLLIAIWKISAAIAAGNTIVLKPSEMASVSTLELMNVIVEADLPPGLINVVTGGPSCGEALVRHKDIRLISFTGGENGGKAVAKIAGETLKPMILELGGKSPQIVLSDADLDLAVNGISAGIFPPAGQSCIAGSRALVHESLHDELVNRLIDINKKAIIGDPNNPKTHIGPISNKAQFDSILKSIAHAIEEGANCVLGGNPYMPEGCSGWFIEPTIFTDVNENMAVARHEIFGPVLAILPFADEEDAIRMANDSNFGLAAGIWSKDTSRALHMADKIKAGTVYINNYFASTPQSPVGGFKSSGYGRENGIEGYLAFTQTKSVWLDLKPYQSDPFQ